MPSKICVVDGCRKETYPGCGIPFHRIPKNAELKEKWIQVIPGNINSSSVICGLHFKIDDYDLATRKRLKSGVIPSIFPKIIPESKKIRVLSVIQLVGPENVDPESSESPPCKKVKLQVEISTQTPPPKTTEKELKQKLKALKQKIKRRGEKIKSLQSILDILKAKCSNYDEMETVLTNNFSNIHIQLNKKKSDKGMRFSDEVKSFALTVYFYSAKAYRYLRNYICIPHPSTLRKLISTHNCNVGFISEVLSYLKDAASVNPHLQNVALVFDAMSIRTELKQDEKTDKYWGYIDYGGIMPSDSETLATEVLIFQIVSFTTKFKCPIAYFFTNKITAHIQAHLLLAAIRFLGDININVRSLTCDGTEINLKTYKVLGCNFSLENMRTFFEHPQNKKNIYCILDPPHMIKLARNMFAETKINSEKGNIEYKFVKKLHKLQEEEGLKLANKLSRIHINFHGKKMNVRLATQVLSSSVADAIDFLRCSGNQEFLESEATVEYIRKLDRVFDLLNCKQPFGKGFKSPMRQQNYQVWSEVLEETRIYLSNLKVNGEPILQHRRKTAALGLIIDTYSFAQLACDLLKEGIVKYFLSYKCSQDHLEMFFSCLRASGGHNDNPSALQVRYALRKLLFRNSVTPSINANSIDADFETTPILDFKSKKNFINEPETISDDKNHHEVEALLKLVEETNLSEYKNNILYYISGVIVKKIFEKSTCKDCKAALVANKYINREHDYAVDINNFSAFTVFVDRGGLKHVSKFVFDVVLYTEKVFSAMIKNSLKKTSKKYILVLVAQYFYDKLESIFYPPHPVHAISCESRHEVILLKTIAFKYLTMRMKTHAKEMTQIIIGSRATLRHKLHKTILFSNV